MNLLYQVHTVRISGIAEKASHKALQFNSCQSQQPNGMLQRDRPVRAILRAGNDYRPFLV